MSASLSLFDETGSIAVDHKDVWHACLYKFKGVYMFKKLILLIGAFGLSGCTLATLPVTITDTATSIVKMPISAIGKVVDAVSNDSDDDSDEE